MGSIVSAAATSHTFGSSAADPMAAERIQAGMAEIGRIVSQSNPDILIVASSDHLNNFTMDAQIPLAIGISDEYVPLGDMGVPKVPFMGSREFGSAFAAFCAQLDFDLVPVENVRPDHGIGFPNAFSNAQGKAKLVPLYVNTVMTPSPSCARAYALGKALRNFVETQRPAGERVAVLGTGGLSHWVCLPESGNVNAQWDRRVMECLTCGRGAELAALTYEEIFRDGGNGGLEIATWAFVAGASGDAKGRAIYYEAMTSWWTGMGGVVMDVS